MYSGVHFSSLPPLSLPLLSHLYLLVQLVACFALHDNISRLYPTMGQVLPYHGAGSLPYHGAGSLPDHRAGFLPNHGAGSLPNHRAGSLPNHGAGTTPIKTVATEQVDIKGKNSRTPS